MLRINLLLLVIAVGCALAVVAANNRARKNFAELEREQNRMHDLDVEWGQLQLEQSTWAAHARIERIARERLGMKAPAPGHVVSLDR